MIIPGSTRSSRPKGPVMSDERIVRANGVDLCVQTFGDPGQPPILLIHGAAASMLAWDDEFCRRLAAGPRFVIRYDHRDTGRSVSYPPGAPRYTLDDLAADAAALLDVYGLERAHVVGRSMGGALAMRMALDRPERVASLTLMVTSPGGAGLSPPSPAFLAHIQSTRPPDWSDRSAVVDHVLALLRVFDGGAAPVERWITRDMVAREVDRTANIASALTNHFLIGLGEPIRPRLGQITAPTLVVQGARDPVFPPDHAQALAAEIPGARLLVLPGCGHLVLAPSWDTLVPAMLAHTAPAMLMAKEKSL